MSVSSYRGGFTPRLLRTVLLCAAGFLFVQLISLYLSWPKQMVLGGVSILLALVVNRVSNSRVVTFALILISITATLRYAWWRVNLLIDFFSDGSSHRISLDAILMLVLISTEAYTIVIMVLGYMQTAWPLRRTPILLPGDESRWPHVDVLIPTYNEPLSLVRYTALAAIQMDYPPEKLHVHILDDGTREEFREFAQEAGIGYVTRKEHKHAKAGNINHALTRMDSPYVAIFDCDHVPTRSFLQLTLGWMLADKKLAMLQTPHHFYSPDPFERNLLRYQTIPNEGELFYGIVQDGNDLWNATFFCGSCALLRRSVLDEVGGIAVETVTEDAHTSLRMQKLGYNTAYINIPQAAGLATETLAAHVGQRIRWARGMIQILRTDNPLLARGMKFTQRLCYLNAMLHFLYAVPRLVFLCAPLVYMLLGRTIIPGYWVAIVAYAVPHLVLSSLTNSRIQSRHRHSFWNEIYETVLAPYILAPTLLALINPKLGKFNVTDKGNTLSDTRFDRSIATPTAWLLFLNFLGVAIAPYRLLVLNRQHPGTVVMNLVWILFNIVILGVAAAVAHEQKQRRGSVRIAAKIPVAVRLPDGRWMDGVTTNMSVSGAAIRLSGEERPAVRDRLRISFPEHAGEAEIQAAVAGSKGDELRVTFFANTIAEQETVTRALYSRADAWLEPEETREVDRPLRSLGRIIRLAGTGIGQLVISFLPGKRQPARTGAAQTATMLLLLLVLGGGHQSLGATTRAKAKAASAAAPAPGSDALSHAQQELTLADLGVGQTIEMHGPHSWYSTDFNLSFLLVPQHATLRLFYAISPGLDPQVTSLRVNLNGSMIATLRPRAGSASGDGQLAEADVPVPVEQLVRRNQFTFEFTGSGVMEREDEARSAVLARISPDSSLEVSGYRLRLQNDISHLPLPFFDPGLQSPTVIPFVFLAQPSSAALEAGGIIASWFGLLARSQPVRFSAALADIPSGNVVVLSEHRSAIPASLQLPAGAGPIVALRDNPNDPYGSVLVVAGDNGSELLTAARSLSLLKPATAATAASGERVPASVLPISDRVMPAARRPDDAPRWLTIRRNASITGDQSADTLTTDGSRPVPIYFHLPPDIFYGERQVLKLHLAYRYTAQSTPPGSALRIVVNGTRLNDIALAPGPAGMQGVEQIILLPIAALRPFGNTILFNFDFAPTSSSGSSQAPVHQGEILPASSLDLHGLPLWTRMPNLQLFANAGFPFTRMADLSGTAVILPQHPAAAEIALYLHLMGLFGGQTGYPALRVTVAGPNTVIRPDLDYLVIGSPSDQPAFASLGSLLPVAAGVAGIRVQQARGYFAEAAARASDLWSGWFGAPAHRTALPARAAMPEALVEEIQSPASPQRSFVVVALKNSQSSEAFSAAFVRRSQSDDISGAVSLLEEGKFHSFPVPGASYHIGNISWFGEMRFWLVQYFLLLLLLVTALSFVVAVWLRDWLSDLAHERLILAERARLAE